MRLPLLNKKEIATCARLYELTPSALRAVQAVLLKGQKASLAADEQGMPVDDVLDLSRKIERDFLLTLTQEKNLQVQTPFMHMSQFECIAKLIRSKEPARSAAMMVLVMGWSAKSTVRLTGLKTQSVWNTCQRFRSAYIRLTKVFPDQASKASDGSDSIFLTPEQFSAVAFFIRSREPASSAAKLVLVYNQGKSHAAREVGIQLQSCWNTIERFKAALRLIRPHFPGPS